MFAIFWTCYTRILSLSRCINSSPLVVFLFFSPTNFKHFLVSLKIYRSSKREAKRWKTYEKKKEGEKKRGTYLYSIWQQIPLNSKRESISSTIKLQPLFSLIPLRSTILFWSFIFALGTITMSSSENFQRFDIGSGSVAEERQPNPLCHIHPPSFYFARDFRKDSRHAEK